MRKLGYNALKKNNKNKKKPVAGDMNINNKKTTTTTLRDVCACVSDEKKKDGWVSYNHIKIIIKI